jgi:hypothetical protein
MALHLPSLADVENAVSEVQTAIPVLEGLTNLLPAAEHAAVLTALKVAAEVLVAVAAGLHAV